MILESLKVLVVLAFLAFPGVLFCRLYFGVGYFGPGGSVFYGFGLGILLLYIGGGLMVRMPFLFHRWHFVMLLLSILLSSLLALYAWRKRRQKEDRLLFSGVLRAGNAPGLIMLLVVLLIASVLLIINVAQPVFDSDATNPFRWVGLAKIMYRLGGLSDSTYLWHPYFPSLIPLYLNSFTVRWFDSFAAFPWFLFYFSMIGISFSFLTRYGRSITEFATYPFVLALTPMLGMHVIRPGFSDLIVSYFVMAIVTLLFDSLLQRDRRLLFLSLAFALGLALTKKEGLPWILVLYGSFGALYLFTSQRVSARKLLVGEVCLICISSILYLIAAPSIAHWLKGGSLLGMLFRPKLDGAAIGFFIEQVFFRAAFGLYWWFFLAALIVVATTADNTLFRLTAIHCGALWLGLFFFSCFTGNVHFTLQGTNVCRLMLQAVPLGVPVYAMLLLRLRGKTLQGPIDQ
jgi:hypothetical protein